MNFQTLYNDFKKKSLEIKPFIKEGIGKFLFIFMIIIMVLIFVAPLLPNTVGTALIGCVAAPYLTLIWRNKDKKHAIVPAMYFSICMLFALLIYLIAGDPKVAAYYLIAIICLILCATSDIISFFDKITDEIKMYLSAGAICLAIVIISSITALLVSIAWWILMLIAFVILLAFFLIVVLGTAAYTATDDTRQAKKKNKSSSHIYSRKNLSTEEKIKLRNEIIDIDNDNQ